jgi:hypothetical protein
MLASHTEANYEKIVTWSGVYAMAQDRRAPGRAGFYAAAAGALSASYWLGER